MRYVYEGDYREYRGYVFWNRQPVTIRDRATLEMIRKEHGFKEIVDKPQEAVTISPQIQTKEIPKSANPDACPKCGKVIKKYRTQHVKWCRK